MFVALLAAAGAALGGGAAPPASFCADEGWTQVWADEFGGTALNESVWTINTNAGDSQVRESQGTRDNVYLEGGHLVRSLRTPNPPPQPDAHLPISPYCRRRCICNSTVP